MYRKKYICWRILTKQQMYHIAAEQTKLFISPEGMDN